MIFYYKVLFFYIPDLDPREHLARQRQQLNKRLGLDVAGGLGMTSEDLFKEEDLVLQVSSVPSDMASQRVSSLWSGWVLNEFADILE